MHLAHWSTAKTKNRETEPEGLGWELFKNYLIALEKFKPDFFLYENNKSMAPAIRAQISAELGVEPILINSTLVSAQNRQRLYWTNIPGVERLTKRSKIGTAFFDDDGVLIRGANGAFHQKKDMTTHYIHDRLVALDKAIDRLATYEDTGLEPEEIMLMKGSWEAACKKYGINCTLIDGGL